MPARHVRKTRPQRCPARVLYPDSRRAVLRDLRALVDLAVIPVGDAAQTCADPRQENEDQNRPGGDRDDREQDEDRIKNAHVYKYRRMRFLMTVDVDSAEPTLISSRRG
jgi:hypothetical protein